MSNAQKALKDSEQLTDDFWMGDQKEFRGGEGVRVVDPSESNLENVPNCTFLT